MNGLFKFYIVHKTAASREKKTYTHNNNKKHQLFKVLNEIVGWISMSKYKMQRRFFFFICLVFDLINISLAQLRHNLICSTFLLFHSLCIRELEFGLSISSGYVLCSWLNLIMKFVHRFRNYIQINGEFRAFSLPLAISFFILSPFSFCSFVRIRCHWHCSFDWQMRGSK